MKKPSVETIREWLNDEPTRWLLERIAFHLNKIDTVSNIKDSDSIEKVAIDQAGAKKAKDVIVDVFNDIYEAGKIEETQKEVAKNEDNVIKNLQDFD